MTFRTGTADRIRRVKYRPARALSGRASTILFIVFALAIIAFHLITLATGVAHYEFHGLLGGFDYSIDLGPIHYHYGKGFGRYERTYTID